MIGDGGQGALCYLLALWPLWQVLLDFEIPPHLLLFLLGLSGPVRPPLYTRTHTHTCMPPTVAGDGFDSGPRQVSSRHGSTTSIWDVGGGPTASNIAYIYRRRQSSFELLGELQFMIELDTSHGRDTVLPRHVDILLSSCTYIHIYDERGTLVSDMPKRRTRISMAIFSSSLSLFLSPCFLYIKHTCSCRRLSSLGLATINQLGGLLSRVMMRARGMLAVAASITGDE